MLTKKRKQFLWKFWGYLLLPIIALAIWSVQVGAAPIAVIAGLATAYMLLQAPVPCGAPTRKRYRDSEQEYCRRNARGLLGGCNQNVQHKWANGKLLASRSKWGQFLSNLMTSGKGVAAGVSALAASATALIASVTLLVEGLQ